MRKRALVRGRAALALAVLVLLGGCATGKASREQPQKGSYARYQKVGSEEPRIAVGGCRPLMAPLVDAFEPDNWGRFGSDGWGADADKRHSCWHRVWEVPTAIVAYPAVAGIMIVLISAPIWVPLLLLL